MAKMVPDFSEEALARMANDRRTAAEIKVYRALKAGLPDTCLVRYRVPWLNPAQEPVEGEADFVVFHPKYGILVIEVKGGGIEFDPRADCWTSTSRDGVVHPLRDPFLQAEDSKFQLYRLLSEFPEWRTAVGGRPTLAHAAFFPDLTRAQCDTLRTMHIRRAIVGSRDDLAAIDTWVSGCFREFHRDRDVSLEDRGVRAAERLLCRTLKVRPLAARAIEDEEERRIILTEQQMLVLDVLEHRQRVAISGGAGTGKTMLARAKAERLAAAGRRTLLVCFNRPLAAYLERSVAGIPNLTVRTIGQLFADWVAAASARLGRDLIAEAEADHRGKNHFDVIVPHAFLLAVDGAGPPPFDAVVIDEGQDFSDETWCALDFMIDACTASLWIFFDPNQKIYARAGNFPIRRDEDIFPLTRNCRNTRPIHSVVYLRDRYVGPPVTPPGIDGIAVEHMIADSLQAQARLVQSAVRRYLQEGVSARDIVVLMLPISDGRRAFVDALRAMPLPDGVQWTEDIHGDTRKVLIDTVARFKGLEAAVLVLWLGLDIDDAIHREIIYVGTSRARSRLVLVGTRDACEAVARERER